jgi:hypothetical protein
MISLEPSKMVLMRIAQKTLHRDRFLAARRERFGCLVTAPAADLHRVVGDLPALV